MLSWEPRCESAALYVSDVMTMDVWQLGGADSKGRVYIYRRNGDKSWPLTPTTTLSTTSGGSNNKVLPCHFVF